MEKPIENYWSLRLADLKNALEANNFEVHIAENADAATKIVMEILPGTGAKSMSWGGSMTHIQIGLYRELKRYPGIEVIDTYPRKSPRRKSSNEKGDPFWQIFSSPEQRGNQDRKAGQSRYDRQQGSRHHFRPQERHYPCRTQKIVPDIEDAMIR